MNHINKFWELVLVVVLLEPSVTLACVDVKADMKQDMDPASTMLRALEDDHGTIDSLPITTLTSAVERIIKSV